MSILELRHIRKSFDGQGVLEDISLSVPAGSVTAAREVQPEKASSPMLRTVSGTVTAVSARQERKLRIGIAGSD